MASFNSDPFTTPAMKAPPGLQSNLIDPPSTKYSTITICVLVILLSTPFVLVRLYTRRFITHQLWWDDWCCVLGWIFEIALIGLLLRALDYGGGTDMWNVSKANEIRFVKAFHDIEIIARIGMFFTKVSIVLLYHRLFLPPGTKRSHIWWSIWFVFYWNLFYAIALVLTVITECVGKADKVAKGENCVNQYAVVVCASVINVVSDLMILIIPIAAIWGLHMTKERKIKLSAVFAIGLLGVAASVARLGYQIPEAKRPNQTIIIMVLSELNLTEHMIGLIVSSMPSLPAFVNHLRGRAPSPSVSLFAPTSSHSGLEKDPKKTNKSPRFTTRSSKQSHKTGKKHDHDDPSLLHSADSRYYGDAGYEELTELEGQKELSTNRDRLEGFMMSK